MPKTFKNIVNNVITLIRMYKIWKGHRIKKILELKNKKRFRGQKAYAIEYFLQKPTKMIKQGDLLYYCDNRRKEDTNGKKVNFKDNSRGIEQLRKDILPYCWKERKVNGELYFIYLPELKELVTEEIINNSKHKNDGFSKKQIIDALEASKNTCELTGLDVEQGNLAADHWIPKEGGGKSIATNCVILNKVLNEKKNKKPPVDYFCSSLLNNFLTISQKTGMDMEKVKEQLINSIREF